ncbi:hypothetical protein GCM10027258_93320 [Amycolatopsis stemonae]
MTRSVNLHVVPLHGRPSAEIRTGRRPVKAHRLRLVWIALGLLIASGGIAWAVTAVTRHIRRYTTALLKLSPSAR